jgi:hypothetical protein
VGGTGRARSGKGRGKSGATGAAAIDLGQPGSPRRQVIYEESRRILDRQATVLGELRDRANILLTANAVVATIFSATALGKGHPLGLEIAAIVVFGLGVVFSLLIVWPVHDEGDLPGDEPTDSPAGTSGKQRLPGWTKRPWKLEDRPRQWRVTFSPGAIATFLESTDTGTTRQTYDLFRRARTTNWKTIGKLNRWLVYASGLLGLQIVLWAWVVI